MKKFSLLATDLFILYLGLLATLVLRYGQGFKEQVNFHLLPFSVLFVVWLFVFYIANLYEISFLKNGAEFYGTFFKTIATNTILGIAFFYLLPFWEIAPRRNLFLFLAIFAVLDFTARILFNRIILAARFKKPTLIVGRNEQAEELVQFLKKNPQWGFRPEAIFDLSRQASLADLKKIIEEKNIDTVVISPEIYKIPRLIETFYQLLHRQINFYSLSTFYEKISYKVPLASIDQAWFLENLSEGRKKVYEIIRRSLDIIFSIIFGLATLILLPIIALAIRLSSPGSIFFRQTRVGQLGRNFSIIKFRTMVADAESQSGAVWAKTNDPRTTKIGKFLRRTRLDELPQLLNIFKGEMSFVGPRAERPEFHEELKKSIPFYEERYLIRPGLTGWAQIQYRYGASVKDAAEKLKYDLFYIKHRSLALDFSIVLKTANIVIRQAGR